MLTETEQAALVRRLIDGEPMTRLESITARVLHGIGGSQRDRDDLLWVLADLDAARGQAAALRRYARHQNGCRAQSAWKDQPCDCGLFDALAAPQPAGAALSAQPQDGEAGRG